MGIDNSGWLRQLEARLADYRAAEKAAEEALRRAEENLEKATEELQLAENYYRQELRRLGVSEPAEAPGLRFKGLSLRDACLAALDESKHRVAREDLIRILGEGGFSFRSPTPGREIHAALLLVMKTGKVRRTEDAYELVKRAEGEPARSPART